jgi:hypothetical protein
VLYNLKNWIISNRYCYTGVNQRQRSRFPVFLKNMPEGDSNVQLAISYKEPNTTSIRHDLSGSALSK